MKVTAPFDVGRTLWSEIRRACRPRPRVCAWDWVCKHGRTPAGEPFDCELMPWARGPCEAWDDPKIRKIVLMWGTRLGKTMIGMQLMACAMATRPLPGLFGTASEKLAARTVGNKIYPVLERIRQTREQLLPKHLRSVRELKLRESTWPVVWSGSATMLADWAAGYGYANEIDKWDAKKSDGGDAKEGDTLAQFEERFKDTPDHKMLLECSPSLKGKSRIEREWKTGNRCLFQVPCPHCGAHQALKMGTGAPKSGGLKFERDANGKVDAELARRTAYYECEKCYKAIRDEQRDPMMRRGVWCPAGCRVTKAGKVVGTPERDGEVWSGKVSSLYSLQLRWGDVAAKFVQSLGNPRLLQMFVNGWLAETWEPYRNKSEPQEVGARLVTETPRGVIPRSATWLFAAVDVQESHFVYVLVACGPGERLYLVDWGMVDTWEEVESNVIDREVPHEDATAPPLRPCLTLIDSGDGNRTKEVYGFCRKHSRGDRLVMPCKGANSNLNGEPYQIGPVGDGTKGGNKKMKRRALAARGVILARVNPFFWQPEINQYLEERRPGQERSLSLPQGADEDDELLEQLCNGAQSHEPSKLDPDKFLWVKRWDEKADDFRDALKYVRCAMELKFRGDWSKAERRQPTGAEASAAARPASQPPRPTLRGRGRRLTLRRRRLR